MQLKIIATNNGFEIRDIKNNELIQMATAHEIPRIKPLRLYQFEKPKPGMFSSVLSWILSPMGLILISSLFLIICTPLVMSNMSEEEMRELQQQRAGLSSFFSSATTTASGSNTGSSAASSSFDLSEALASHLVKKGSSSTNRKRK